MEGPLENDDHSLYQDWYCSNFRQPHCLEKRNIESRRCMHVRKGRQTGLTVMKVSGWGRVSLISVPAYLWHHSTATDETPKHVWGRWALMMDDRNWLHHVGYTISFMWSFIFQQVQRFFRWIIPHLLFLRLYIGGHICSDYPTWWLMKHVCRYTGL